MKHKQFAIVLGSAIILAVLGEPCLAATQTTEFRILALSAAQKKSTQTRYSDVPGQIACTIDGCHPIPPGCHPETGYNWDGIPTGFDIVVCYPRRGRRR